MNIVVRNFFTVLFIALLGSQIVISTIEAKQTTTEKEGLPLDELRIFTEVFSKIKNDYVEPVDDRQLLEDAIRGMLEGLDPHSSYLDKEAYQELQEGTTGEFGGLGIEVGLEDGFVKVIAPIDDTPAQKAGIQSGDLIIRIDDTPVKGMSLNDAVTRMRGKPGTNIDLTIVRDGIEKPFKITLQRDIIKIKSVKHKTLEPGYGYLRISNFQSNTSQELNKQLDKLKEDNNNNLKGLIIDLRNNPGGILNAAVDVADTFLDKGLIVYTEGRIQDSQLKFNAKPGDALKNIPIVVMVNEGSASASEIVAGALQDHNRAIIIGEQTFGKGSVQTILPMNNEAAVKLTTARYYTPSGRSIQASGIKPDILIDKVKLTSVESEFDNTVKEINLSGHLENEQDMSGTEAEPEINNEDEAEIQEEIPLSVSDYDLYEALNILKALVISKSQ